MKNILTILFIIYSYLVSTTTLTMANETNNQKTLVFSDMDDTVKISYVRNKIEMISFSGFADSLFYGMNSVYQVMAETNGARFFYVTNGWKPSVKEVHQKILSDFEFPNKENFFARSLIKILKKYPHKLATIVSITMKENPDIVVLIGDNGEKDPKIYYEVRTALTNYFRSQGKKITVHTFIHTVYEPQDSKTLDLYPGQKPFVNAADLAIKLAQINLMDNFKAKGIVADVVNKIQSEGKYSVYGPLVNPFFKQTTYSIDSIMCKSFYTK